MLVSIICCIFARKLLKLETMGVIRFLLVVMLTMSSMAVVSQTIRTEDIMHVDGPKLFQYGLVFGSFGLRSNAEGLQMRLKSYGYDATIVKSKERNIFRVVAASSNSVADIKELCNSIQQTFPGSWILLANSYDYVDNASQKYYAQNEVSVQKKANNVQRYSNLSSTPVQNTTLSRQKQKSSVNDNTSQSATPIQNVPAVPVQKSLSPVDKNIPIINQEDRNTFAVIIGNEKYKNVAGVPFAENDAKVFSEYVQKTLGVPSEQIKLIENATYNDIRISLNWLEKAMTLCNGKGKAIVYYAGHGIPSESDNSSYLLPVDGVGNDPASAYSLRDFYQKLGRMQSQSVMVFLDACFSGSKRDNGMLVAARGVAIKAKPSAPKGKMVVFSAAQGDETAYPYQDMQHGMFTYFLLKKLQESKGNITLGELGNYLKEEVKRQSFLKNNKIQTPMISVASDLQTTWKNIKLK